MTAQPSAETVARLKYYPDYVDDPDGLARLREAVKCNRGHDMAAVNHNSLGRLIDTIERLRRERDAALAHSSPPASDVVGRCAQVADAERDEARIDQRAHSRHEPQWWACENVATAAEDIAAAIRRLKEPTEKGDGA